MKLSDILDHLKDGQTIRGLLVLGSTLGFWAAPQADAIYTAVLAVVGLYAALKPKTPAA